MSIMMVSLRKEEITEKLVSKQVLGNVSLDVEWLKWLSYEPEFERARIEKLEAKKISETSNEELMEIRKYQQNILMKSLFKKYRTGDCLEEEYMMIDDYICSESIEKLMLSKLTSLELKQAKEEIIRLSNLSKEELMVKVSLEQSPEEYEKLSMVDAYILHVVSNSNYIKEKKEIGAWAEKKYLWRQRKRYLWRERRGRHKPIYK